jgi:hypothetical protein
MQTPHRYVFPQLHKTYVSINEETDKQREELELKFITQEKSLCDFLSVKRAEELLDNAFEAHPIRQSALVRRKKDKVVFDRFDFDESHLRFIIHTLVDHELIQQKHLESGLEIDQKGLPLPMLNYLLDQQFKTKSSQAKLLKFLCMREYSRNFQVFTYKIPQRPKLDFISLQTTQIPRFFALPTKMELEDSHVPLIRSLIETNDTHTTWLKLALLKQKLMVEHDVRPAQLKEFLERFPCDFVVGKHRQALSVRLTTAEEAEQEALNMSQDSQKLDISGISGLELEEEHTFDLPDFELPHDFEVVVSHDEKIIQKWVFDNVQFPLLQNEKIVIGIDSEWSIINLNPLAIINPHLFHNLKRKHHLREHDQGSFPDLIQISTERTCLLLQTLGGQIQPPQELVQILCDPRVLKVFCNYTSDLLRLKNWLQHFDIHVAMPGLIDIDEKGVGCSRLCAEKLKLNYSKQRSLQLSRWSKRELSNEQISYAAKDAYLNVLFYENDPSMAKEVSDTIEKKKKKENTNEQ